MENKLDSFVTTFQQLYLQELQQRQIHVKPNEIGALFDKYKEKHTSTKEHANKTLEQILLSLPLWIISQEKPSHLSATDYVRFVNNIDDEILVLRELLKTSFNLA
jgi:hypothetical protein